LTQGGFRGIKVERCEKVAQSAGRKSAEKTRETAPGCFTFFEAAINTETSTQKHFAEFAHVAQLVEHVLGKDEVTGSIPVMGSSLRGAKFATFKPTKHTKHYG
jgi:hypothetical protein